MRWWYHRGAIHNYGMRCFVAQELPMSASNLRHVGWTFLSNHATVLLCVARDATMRTRDIAMEVGITERAVRQIMSDLEDDGYVERVRNGRRNSYRVDKSLYLRHPIGQHKRIAALIRMINC